MNRRNFFKLSILGSASLSLIGIGMNQLLKDRPKHNELEDLYNFCESVPLGIYNYDKWPAYKWQNTKIKLTPEQKVILKTIHENKFVYIIKGRQIGFTTLTAAYSAWRWKEDHSIDICPISPSWSMQKFWGDNFYRWAPNYFQDSVPIGTIRENPLKFNPLKMNVLNTTICVFDETNMVPFKFSQHFNHLHPLFKAGAKGKLIIGGSVDNQNIIENFYNSKKFPEFVGLREPVTKFPELWNEERIRFHSSYCPSTELFC